MYKGCKGSVGLASSRIFKENCICPNGYYDDWPHKLEC